MFAFLTAESLVVWAVGTLGAVFGPFVARTLGTTGLLPTVLDGIFACIFLLSFFQMITITFLGLYYLGDRLHQPDARSDD